MDDRECTRPDWHSGYIVTLNTLARFFDDTRRDVEEYCTDVQNLAEQGDKEFCQHTHTYMTFGDFDRITFNDVNRFSRFFDLDERSKYWLGKHQNVYLYQIKSDPLDENNPGPRLFPYKKGTNIKKKNPFYNDFGFCINYNPDKWYLFSSNYGNDAEYNNSEFTDRTAVFPFLILTQISLSNDILFRIADMGEFLIQLRTRLISLLDPIIDEHCSEIKYEIYGCLNTSELCILWIAEQYTDVLSLLDELKKMEFDIKGTKGPLFFTVYSIIGRLLSNSTTVDKSEIEKCKGTAQVDIIVNNTCSGYELLDTLKDLYNDTNNKTILPDKSLFLEAIENSCKRVGEHDLSLRVPASMVYDFFNEGDNSNAKGVLKHTAVREKILGTRVALLHDNSNRFDMLHKGPLVFDSPAVGVELIVEQFTELHEELDPNLNEYSSEGRIRSLYKKIRKYLKDNFSSHTGSVDTLDMLYTDYLSNIHESYNAIWRNDYNYQFKNSLILLKTQLKSIDDEKDAAKKLKETDPVQAAKHKNKADKEIIKFWELYPQIIDNIRQQTSHFSQSGRLVMRIPSSHLRYTACCDLMFHGYYGMVKAILYDAYFRQNNDSFQSELLPVITTNSNTDIRSKLFFVGPNCYDLRLLHIDIPYSLLYDPVTGFPYMIHEMFHYIVPNSRDNRNKAIGAMVFNEVLTLQYMYQFYECLKLYDHTESDIAFEKKIKHFKEKNYKGDEVCHNAVSELANSLKSVLWNDKALSEKRDNIITSVIDIVRKDNDPTWTNFLNRLEQKLSQLSLPVYELISERLLKNMYESEQASDQLEKKNFINCSDSLNKKSTPRLKRIISYYERLVYDHKLTLLNPNSIYRANVKSALFSGIRDTVITGLREASPDMAMVMYCNMDEVSYLVSCARQIDSSISKMTASYEVVRIPIVLAWIYSRKYGVNNEDVLEFKKLLSQPEIRNDFLIKYMVEYLPQDPTRDKLVKLITDAIVWYWRFKNLIRAFDNEYSMYVNKIIEYGQCYHIYYAETDDRTSTVKQLIKTAIDRRNKKIDVRKKLLHDDIWEKITEICEECDNKDNKLIDDATPPVYDKIHKYIEEKFPNKFDIEGYKSNNKIYNRASFDTSLKFVHQAARQITLEELKEEVKVNTDTSSDEQESGIKEQPPSDIDLTQQVYRFTVRRAWGMTEFTDILRNIRSIISTNEPRSRLWYLAKSEKECLLPSVYQNEEPNRIVDILTPERSNFFDKQIEYNPFYKSILELVPQEMAVENERNRDNSWQSNMIVWHKDLVTSLKQLYTDDSNICLYLFSPVAYLKAREFILDNLGVRVDDNLHFNYVPLILKDRKEIMEDTHSYFIINTNTSIKDKQYKSDDLASTSKDHIRFVMPVPYIIENGRYLAYNLILKSKEGKYNNQKAEPECALYTMDQIQTMMLRLIEDKFKDEEFRKKAVKNGGDGEFKINNWAFFYTIKIDSDIVNGINNLSKIDLSKNTTQR